MGKPDIWARMETGRHGLKVRLRRTRPRHQRRVRTDADRARQPHLERSLARRPRQRHGNAGPDLANEAFLADEYATVVLPNRITVADDHLKVRRSLAVAFDGLPANAE